MRNETPLDSWKKNNSHKTYKQLMGKKLIGGSRIQNNKRKKIKKKVIKANKRQNLMSLFDAFVKGQNFISCLEIKTFLDILYFLHSSFLPWRTEGLIVLAVCINGVILNSSVNLINC